MKKKFKLFILNENSNFNFSISLGCLSVYIICVVTFILFILSMWGMYRFIKPHQNQQHINDAKNMRYNTLELIEQLIESNQIDSTALNQYQLNNYNMFNLHQPISGIVTKGTSTKDEADHPGIDIAATLNSKIESAQEGLVVFCGLYGDYGNTIIVAHPNNYYTLYSHLKNPTVNQRDYISKGQVIGYVGESGKSNGPHLHFEIWKNHIIIDPRELIEEYKIKDVSIK